MGCAPNQKIRKFKGNLYDFKIESSIVINNRG